MQPIQQMIPDKKLSSITRIICFISGLVLGTYMFIYSFRYDDFPHTITILGCDLTGWLLVAGLVLISVFSGWLIQVGLRGRTGFD